VELRITWVFPGRRVVPVAVCRALPLEARHPPAACRTRAVYSVLPAELRRSQVAW